jgi:serine/threonine-protein kinase
MLKDQLAHYRIERELGAGGMGEVYLARDVRLGRRVAIKILPERFAEDPDRLQRFYREGQAASAISHPNVAHVYDVGEADGVHFIAMEYVEGVSLTTRLREGPLSVREAVWVGEQVAEALEAAHAAGVVHRDIKPGNIMLQARNCVKVLDFGLAKHEGAGGADEGSEQKSPATEPGAILGTVPYMSPEQVSGDRIDHRSDIFSLGAVLYESVSGRRAFEAQTRRELISRILRSDPLPLDRAAQPVPRELERILRNCLAKEAGRRYQKAGALAADLERLRRQLDAPEFVTTEPLTAGWEWRGKRLRFTVPPKLERVIRSCLPKWPGQRYSKAGPGASDPQQPVRQRGRRAKRLELAAIGLAAIGLAALGVGIREMGRPSVRSIAVLPFEVISTDQGLNYVGGAISETLAHDLSHLPGLRVASPTLTGHYAGRGADPLAVARALKVEVVLVGHMIARGDSLHSHVELIDVRNGNQIWSQEGDEKLADLAAFQQAMCERITDQLRLQFSGAWKQRLARQYATSSEAYQCYLKGRYHLNRRTLEDFREALRWFEEATARDPRYAPAYAGSADAYALITNYSGDPPLLSLRKAKEAAHRALEIDDTLGEAHASLGFALTMADFDWDAAEREFQRALELDPNFVPAHEWYAVCVLMPQARHEEAVGHIERAIALDPQSMLPRLFLGVEQFFGRHYDAAEQTLRALRAQTPLAGVQLAEVLLARSRPAEALALLDQAPAGAESWVGGLRAYALAWISTKPIPPKI